MSEKIKSKGTSQQENRDWQGKNVRSKEFLRECQVSKDFIETNGYMYFFSSQENTSLFNVHVDVPHST